MPCLVAVLLAASVAPNPRVLVAGTRFDDLDAAAKTQLVQRAEEAFIALGYTVRGSDCDSAACAQSEATEWNAGAVILVSAAKLGREVSIAFKATSPAGVELARGDAFVDAKKLPSVTPALEKFARTLRPKVPLTKAPELPVAAVDPPPPEPEPAPVVIEQTPSRPAPIAGVVLGVAGVGLIVAAVVCFALAMSADGRLAAARTEGAGGAGIWSISRPEADGLRSTVRLDTVLAAVLAAAGVGAGTAAVILW